MKMNRRTFCVQPSMTIAGLTAFAKQPLEPSTETRAVSMPSDRADDSYAVFSLLIPVLQTTKKEYLVSNTTENPRRYRSDVQPVSQTKPPMTPIQYAMSGGGIVMDVPDDWMAQFNEAVEEFRHREGIRVQLERKLNLPFPYRLIDSKGMDEYLRLLAPRSLMPQGKPWHRDPKLEQKYMGQGPLIRMSEVYFDHEHSLGLVHASSLEWDEGPGGNGCTQNWYAFEKRDGNWIPAPWGGYEVCSLD